MGFTLLETLVVLVVVGVVSAMSLGKLHTIMVQQRGRRAATSLQTDLEGAFSIANRNRTPVRIAWDATNMQLNITDRAGTVYRRTTLGRDPYGFRSGNVTVSSTPVEIFPNGLANTALTVTLTVESTTKTVSMSRAGMVRVQ
jgi:prepilin-type N-terminal cleavage/methylation domain-containing protein